MAAEHQLLNQFKVAGWFRKWDFGPLHQTKLGLFNVGVHDMALLHEDAVEFGLVEFVSATSACPNRVRMRGSLCVGPEGLFEIRTPHFHVAAEPIAQANSKLLSDSFKKTLDVFAELAIRHGS